MARPRMFNETAVLDAAAGQFRVLGFADTTTEQLCEAAGMGRGSLYNAFTSKDELFVRALERYVETTGAAQAEVVEDTDLDGLARLRGVLDLVLAEEESAASEGRAAGCMVVGARMTPRVEERDGRVKRILDQALDQQLSLYVHAVESGKRDGTLRPGIRTRDAAMMLVSIISGLRALAQAGSPPDELRRVADLGLEALRP